jgi:6-phosphogluconate dehydrogenase
MKLGFIGLGKMGKNMVLNLLDSKRYTIVGLNRTSKVTKQLAQRGLIPSYNVEELVSKLPKRKIVWLMVPAGKPVDQLIKQLIPQLNKNDIIIDGGNSFFKDSIRRHNALKKHGIHYFDCGTSGGQGGARNGACMMIGGNKRIFKTIEHLFSDMCVKNGYGYMGSTGAGHFVKMVHNGVEYGMMSAIAEGMNAVKKHKKSFGTDMLEVAKVYSHGSIISGSLMSWLNEAMQNKKFFKSVSGKVPKGATEDEMKLLESLAPMPILNRARKMRVSTRKKPSYQGQIIAALRNMFGGHAFNKK